MYQWTHVELARHQPNGNGPKIDHDEKVQEHLDPTEPNHNDNKENIASEAEQQTTNVCIERDESFATVKNKLLSTENRIDPLQSTENGEVRQNGLVEEVQNGINGHLENDEHLKQNCDYKVETSIVDISTFVEMSTQTDDIPLVDLKEEKKNVEMKTCMPPPPPPLPPPPSPLPSICIIPPIDTPDGKSVDDAPVVIAAAPSEPIPATPQQNTNQINISSTKLSSASSFCPPPPPPMNGVPGPPPLPLPTGNMWFKSDSKFSTFYFHLFISLIDFFIPQLYAKQPNTHQNQ